uniref:Putative reverse transcriptase domain-containing protein n=1 Tax=Tanacetum cinerariifolium TaxID=118510 RepID=A0A6L2NFX2_TANCI|nr:putative reverse transcriptase domain-containing protein [Tanacetum cinerariifolium]
MFFGIFKLCALLVSYGYELNSPYTDLVASKVRIQEKLDRKKRNVKFLYSEVTSLDNKLENIQRDYDALGQENRELRSQIDVTSKETLTMKDFQKELALETSRSQGYKNTADKLRTEDDFKKSLVAFPTTPFPFLGKVVAAARGALSEVTQILPDKLARSATSTPIASPVVNEASDQVPLNHASHDSALSMTASVPYARLNGVSLLWVLGVALWSDNTFGSSSTYAPPSWCSLVLISCIMLRLACSTASASRRGPTMSIPYFRKGQAEVTEIMSFLGSFVASFDRIPFLIYSWIGIIQVLVTSSIIALTSTVSTDLLLSSSISTPFIIPLHCNVASVLKASAFRFSSLGRYDVSVPTLTKDHKENKIQYLVSRRRQYAVFKLYGNKIFRKISNVVPTPRNPQYAMDDANITLEEYIRLEEEKAQKLRKVFNWETAKYSKIWYDEDILDLRSIETEFSDIVFNDNLTSNETLSCKPTASSLNNNEIDFRISFDESDHEDYTVVFDKNSFSDKIISTNDLKTDSENDYEKFNKRLFLSPEPMLNFIGMALQPRDQRHPYLRFEGLQYTKVDITDFETRLARIYRRQIPDKGDLRDYWIGSSSAGDFLGTTPSYTSIRDLILRLCHKLIACSIAGRSQAPKKVYTKSKKEHESHLKMNLELLKKEKCYVKPNKKGLRKPKIVKRVKLIVEMKLLEFSVGDHVMMKVSPWKGVIRFGKKGELAPRLIEESGFALHRGCERASLTVGLISKEGLTVIAPALPIIDMTELVRLQICVEFGDTWAWAPARPAKEEGDARGVAEEALVAPRGGDEDEEMPQAVPPPPKTQGKRIARLEDEVLGMREALQGQRKVLDSMAREFYRFTTWTITSLTWLMDRAGVPYTRYT